MDPALPFSAAQTALGGRLTCQRPCRPLYAFLHPPRGLAHALGLGPPLCPVRRSRPCVRRAGAWWRVVEHLRGDLVAVREVSPSAALWGDRFSNLRVADLTGGRGSLERCAEQVLQGRRDGDSPRARRRGALQSRIASGVQDGALRGIWRNRWTGHHAASLAPRFWGSSARSGAVFYAASRAGNRTGCFFAVMGRIFPQYCRWLVAIADASVRPFGWRSPRRQKLSKPAGAVNCRTMDSLNPRPLRSRATRPTVARPLTIPLTRGTGPPHPPSLLAPLPRR